MLSYVVKTYIKLGCLLFQLFRTLRYFQRGQWTGRGWIRSFWWLDSSRRWALPWLTTCWCTFGPENVCQEEWILESFTKLLLVLILHFRMSMKSYCAADDKEGACKAFLLLPFVIFWRHCQERSVLIRLGNCRAPVIHGVTEGRKTTSFQQDGVYLLCFINSHSQRDFLRK